MSRYDLPLNAATIASGIATELSIGWDRPLDTYFLTLLRVDPETGDAADILWIGADLRECQDIDHILAIAGRYSHGAGAYRDRLVADRARDDAQPHARARPWSSS